MNNYEIREGFDTMDVAAIHNYLNQDSYWAKGIPFHTVETSLKNSYCAGVFNGDMQVGFARFVTDYSTFAYLADVYILEAHRGKGLSKLLMEYMMGKEWTKGLRRLLLATLDAHTLYQQFGFEEPPHPEWLMELKRNNVYDHS